MTTQQSKFDANRTTEHGKRLLAEIQRITRLLEKNHLAGGNSNEDAKLRAQLAAATKELQELSKNTSIMIQSLSNASRNIKELSTVSDNLQKTQKYHSLYQNVNSAIDPLEKSSFLMKAAAEEFMEAAHLIGKYVSEMLPALRQGNTNSSEMVTGFGNVFANIKSLVSGGPVSFNNDQVSKILKGNVDNVSGNFSNVGFGKTLGEIGVDLGIALKHMDTKGNAAYQSMDLDGKTGALASVFEMERRTGNYRSITDQKFLGVFSSQMDALKTIRDNTGVTMEVAKQQLEKNRSEALEQSAIGTISTSMQQAFTGITTMLDKSGQTKLESLYKRSIAKGGVQSMMNSMSEEERTGLLTSPDIMNMLQRLLDATSRGGTAEDGAKSADAITKGQSLDLNRYQSFGAILAGILDNGMGLIRSQAQNYQNTEPKSDALKNTQNNVDPLVNIVNTLQLGFDITLGSAAGQIVASIAALGTTLSIILLMKNKGGLGDMASMVRNMLSSDKALAGSKLASAAGEVLTEAGEVATTSLGTTTSASVGAATEASIAAAASAATAERLAGLVKYGGVGGALYGAYDVVSNGKYKDEKGNITGHTVGASGGEIAGAGLGGFGGAMAGAAIGTMIGGPLGTILGGIAGLGLGAIGANFGAKGGEAVGGGIGGLFDKSEVSNNSKHTNTTSNNNNNDIVNNSNYVVQGAIEDQNIHLSSIKDILFQSLSIQTQTYNAIVSMAAGTGSTRLVPKPMPAIGAGPDFSGDRATNSISQAYVMPGAAAYAGNSSTVPFASK